MNKDSESPRIWLQLKTIFSEALIEVEAALQTFTEDILEVVRPFMA